MPTQEIEVKKQSELLPKSTGGLFSFDEFDNFFDDFMTCKWPRLMDWMCLHYRRRIFLG